MLIQINFTENLEENAKPIFIPEKVKKIYFLKLQ